MTGTMTWVGMDVHARSTHAAAIDVMTGELTRVRVKSVTSLPLSRVLAPSIAAASRTMAGTAGAGWPVGTAG